MNPKLITFLENVGTPAFVLLLAALIALVVALA